MALESGLVFPSHRSFHACCAYKTRASNNETITHTYTHRNNHAAEVAVFYVSQGCMQDTLKLCCCESKRKQVNILLPKLHHCTGEIGGICNGVVCVTFVCVPCVVTWAPWKILKNRNYSVFFSLLFDIFRDMYVSHRYHSLQFLMIYQPWPYAGFSFLWITWVHCMIILTEVKELYR